MIFKEDSLHQEKEKRNKKKKKKKIYITDK